MRVIQSAVVAVLVGVALGCASSSGSGSGRGTSYLIKGEQVEGCECDVYCPCVFSKDASMNECRGMVGWKVTEGHYAGTDLSGIAFASALTKSGKNMEKAMGKWEGILFLPETASQKQKEAITAILKAEMGPAFGKLEVKTAAVSVTCEGEHHTVMIGKVGTLKSTALKGAGGKVTVIENAPSPLALPREYCAKSDVNSYDDGMTKWDFAGRNSFYGPFEMKSK